MEERKETAARDTGCTIRIWTAAGIEGDVTPPRIVGYSLETLPEKEVGPEDVPVDIWLSVGGIRMMTEIEVSPVPDGPVSERLFAFAMKAAGLRGGAAEFFLPGGRRTGFAGDKIAFGLPGPYSERLYLGVWFPPRNDFDYTGLLRTIEECLPHAVPVRYGTGSEPEYTLEGNGGVAGLAAFLESSDFPVCYGRLPVTNVFVCPRGGAGQTGHVGIVLSAEVAKHPEWICSLRRLLRRLSVFTGAFFGQTVTGERQVAGGCWKGIPVMLGDACTIGMPYSALIPDCAAVISGGEGAKGRLCAGTPSGFAGGPGDAGAEGGTVFFEEPFGPRVPDDYLSRRKKNLFGREAGAGRGYPLESDFAAARVIPEGLSGGKGGT